MSEQLELFGPEPDSCSSRLTWAFALDFDWENHGRHTRSAFTRRYQYENLRAFFNDRYIDLTTEEDVLAYRRKREKDGVKGNTINREHGLITALFNRFKRWKRIKAVGLIPTSRWILPEENPGPLVKKVNELVYRRNVQLTPERFALWLSVAHPETRKIAIMAVLTLLRRIDLKTLHKERHVNFFTGQMQGFQSKTGKPWRAPILDTIFDIIEESPGPFILDFTNHRRRWSAACKKSEVKFQLRDLRKYGAWELLLGGTDLRTIQEYLGHSSGRTTDDWYIGGAPAKIAEAGSLLEQRLKKSFG